LIFLFNGNILKAQLIDYQVDKKRKAALRNEVAAFFMARF